jgi:hypothetical protein
VSVIFKSSCACLVGVQTVTSFAFQVFTCVNQPSTIVENKNYSQSSLTTLVNSSVTWKRNKVLQCIYNNFCLQAGLFFCREGLEKLKAELHDSIQKGVQFVHTKAWTIRRKTFILMSWHLTCSPESLVSYSLLMDHPSCLLWHLYVHMLEVHNPVAGFSKFIFQLYISKEFLVVFTKTSHLLCYRHITPKHLSMVFI